jgi:predicted TIM-barrel fold metal-dependent hydrolase
MPPNWWEEAAEFLDNAPTSESDRAKLAHENACRLFRQAGRGTARRTASS